MQNGLSRTQHNTRQKKSITHIDGRWSSTNTHPLTFSKRCTRIRARPAGIFFSHSSIDGSATNRCGSNKHVVSLSLWPRMKEINHSFAVHQVRTEHPPTISGTHTISSGLHKYNSPCIVLTPPLHLLPLPACLKRYQQTFPLANFATGVWCGD